MNGKSVAILFAYGSVYFLDIESQKLTDPITPGPSTQVALSPDSHLLSVAWGKEVRLYTTSPLQLLGQTTAPTACGFSSDKPNAAFTSDAAYLWVRCDRTPNVLSPATLAAVQYRLPDLQVEATLNSRSAGVIRIIGGQAVMMGFARTVVAERGSPGDGIHFDFECVKLDRKIPCFENVRLRNTRLEPPRKATVSNSFSMLAVGYGIQNPGGSRVDVYDTSSGRMSSSINIDASLFLGSFRELVFTPSGNHLIGAFNAAKIPGSEQVRDGGLLTWNVKSGQMQQDIRRGPVEAMSLSPDGQGLLVITRREILFYEFNG